MLVWAGEHRGVTLTSVVWHAGVGRWTYGGFQDNGMYMNYPHIYQCRTENQCNGCSDPRFRSWYANAATGPKDIILIMDDGWASEGQVTQAHIIKQNGSTPLPPHGLRVTISGPTV